MAENAEAEPENGPTRDAATVILLRGRAADPRILVGQRGANAVFMPNKFVFPGGSVDPADAEPELAGRPGRRCLRRLTKRCRTDITDKLLTCAVREVWEETGIKLALPCQYRRSDLSKVWHSFCAGGLRPSAQGLEFIYRAVTPPGQTRRFDARFFLADLDRAHLASDPDDFSKASTELSHLQWISLSDAFSFDIPSVTRQVITALSRHLRRGGPPAEVPFRFSQGGKRVIEML